jgi:hypothetical protein
MTTGEFPGQFPGESGINPRAAVREQCLEEVRLSLGEIQAAIANGTFDELNYTGSIVGYVVGDMIDEAVAANDGTAAEAGLDLMLQLPDVSSIDVADSCYAVASSGSERAFEVLKGRLEYERSEAIAEMPENMRPYGQSQTLERVIRACQDSDTLPNTWIDTYAVNAEHRWLLYAQHYARMARRGTPEAAANQTGLERKIGEFLEDESFDAAFVYEETSFLIRSTKRPDLKERILERYLEATREVRLDSRSFNQLMSVAGAVLEDHDLGTPQNVTLFENLVSRCADLLREAGMDSFGLIQDQLAWQMAVKRRSGATPQELVDHLDNQVGKMLASDVPETTLDYLFNPRSKEFATRQRDSLLRSYASYHAASGDFGAAQLFIANIGGDISRQFAVQQCLPHVTSQEQIDAIKPDGMTLMFSPELNTQFRVAETLHGGDTQAISKLALELATLSGGDESHIAHQGIWRLYEAVGEPDLARKVLAALRAEGANRHDTENYSELLVRAGDNDEPRKAYEEIDGLSESPSWRLLSMWRLAQQLSGRQGTA